MRKFSRLLFGLSFLVLLNSCSKEATLDEVSPSSVETISELKTWATKNNKLNQANLIEWDNSIPTMLPDSIKGYAAPVKTESGFKEFITFELGGKRHGWFKTYKRLNETDMEIVIQSIEGKTLKSGVLHKSKNVLPKGKTSSMREMNFEEGPITFDTINDNFIFSAPKWYPSTGNYFYWITYQFVFNFKAYYDSDSNLGGSGGGGSSSLNFEDYNTTEFEDNFTNPCFSKVLTKLKTHNFHGAISDIINNFVNSPTFNIKFTNEQILWDDTKTQKLDGGYYESINTIKLSESSLSQASQEYIATVIIHEILHAKIGKTERIDHTTMLREYIKPASEFMHSMYNNISVEQAQNLFLRGVRKNALGYSEVVSIQRSFEIDRDDQLWKFYYGHSCN